MIDILEKCTQITINPRFIVDKDQNPTQVHIEARMGTIDKCTRAISNAHINILAPTLEEAFIKLRIHVDGWVKTGIELNKEYQDAAQRINETKDVTK